MEMFNNPSIRLKSNRVYKKTHAMASCDRTVDMATMAINEKSAMASCERIFGYALRLAGWCPQAIAPRLRTPGYDGTTHRYIW